jgi:hypothetical protein
MMDVALAAYFSAKNDAERRLAEAIWQVFGGGEGRRINRLTPG